MSLILSLFPGLGLLDRGFEAEGFTVVRGPDVIWGGDIRTFHPPAGRFDGVIGGDPCQSHSTLANLVRAKGLEPRFPDMTPDFQRIVEEAQPAWFLRENVPLAPDIAPAGYSVSSFLLCNSWLDSGDGMGEEQMRKRRFWFGVRQGSRGPGWDVCEQRAPDLRRWIELAVFELPKAGLAVCGDARAVPVAIGGSGKVKRSTVRGHDGNSCGSGSEDWSARARDGLKGWHSEAVGTGVKVGAVDGCTRRPARYSIGEMLELQGLPPDFLDHCPFTMEGKRKAIGNGVPQAMGRAIARAVLAALDHPPK